MSFTYYKVYIVRTLFLAITHTFTDRQTDRQSDTHTHTYTHTHTHTYTFPNQINSL